ncbi:DUF3486 family protein [Bacteroidales bacterium MSK.15.36]|nr:DUF3486 family protein [Bacteroidales bacterium MSK.15.36]
MASKKRRANSKISQLPDDIKEKLDGLLLDTSNSYQDISDWLNEQGYKVSKSSVGRYAIRASQATQRVVETLEKTKAIIQAVEKNPDLDYTKASRIVMMDGLLQKVSTAEEEFQEMPLDKAGRLIASLSRAEIYDQKAKRDYKNKMEVALEGLEAELMAKIKEDKDLARDVSAMLRKVKDKINVED